jgi:hypothetical protein
MRVLYLSADPGVPVFGPKGASVHVRSMAGALDELGHDVLIASPRLEPGANRLSAGIRCSEIPAVRPDQWATAAEVLGQAEIQAEAVREIAIRERCEAIYERHSLASFAGARTATALSVPLALEVNAPHEQRPSGESLRREAADSGPLGAGHRVRRGAQAMARD